MTLARSERRGSKTQALANTRLLLRSDPVSAARQAEEVLRGDPRCAQAYRLLGMALRQLGQIEQARRAEDGAIRTASMQQPLFQAALALSENQLDTAEHLLRPYLKEQPDDAAALRMLAEIGARTGHFDAAEQLLLQALAVAPDYPSAKSLLAGTRRVRERMAGLTGQGARTTIGKEEFADDEQPASPEEDHRDALALYEEAVRQFPDVPRNWLSYGHVLRVIGRRDRAIETYRRALAVRPQFGEAWWALADLKTTRFDSAEIEQMLAALRSSDAADDDRVCIHFTLGKAFEQQGAFDHAFDHYRQGNELQSAVAGTSEADVDRHVERSIALFDRAFFAARQGTGYEADDPIFVLGMPRAGSTLVEQILASHSQVEGTMELPDINQLAKWLADGDNAVAEDSRYLPNFAALGPDELLKRGQSYIWSTGLRRKTRRARFIDKMPNNWLHLGMILTILPNAKIIDARRHPLACGFSNYKQHYARGQAFSYNLGDIGRYYRAYVRMMAHFDRLFPGRVHRVIHEQLIDQPETEIRRLLDYCGLPFEDSCLRFHETKRAVKTASSEQVRRPINREGVDQWRPFEPWLDELKQALGPVLDAYPEVPADL